MTENKPSTACESVDADVAWKEGESTGSIDLRNLVSSRLTASGSFDIRGIQATSFGKLLQALPTPAMILDGEGQILFANQSWGRISPNYKRIESRTFPSLCKGYQEAKKAEVSVEKAFSTRKPQVFEAMFDIDGSIIWGRAHLRSVRVGNGRSLLLLVEDLTLEKKQLLMNQRHREELAMRVQERTAELMRINERLEQEMGHRARAEEELRKSERSKAIAEMAGGVAHNFNNLLQILMHGAQMALVHMESGNPTRARAKIKRLIESCKQGAETIRRLQAFAQVRTPDAVKEGKVFDLSETVEKALDMHGPWLIADAEKEGIKIAFQKQLQPNSFVEGHEGELLEVVVNLIKNAAEALTQGGEIRVSTFVNHGKVFLQVRDNGIGIPRENLGKVFQPFWTTKGYHGTGMGLASSLGIVKRHQGQIVLDSREQLGTTVTVTMPFTGQPETDLSSLITCALDRKLSILIIDDESEALTLLEEGFTELGHEVFAARSGQEGIEIFRKNRVDLVISDLAMPGMNGWQVGRAIKEICEQKGIPKAPLILLTGWGGQLDEKEKIEASGIDRVAEKPVSLKELLRLVQEIVGEAG